MHSKEAPNHAAKEQEHELAKLPKRDFLGGAKHLERLRRDKSIRSRAVEDISTRVANLFNQELRAQRLKGISLKN